MCVFFERLVSYALGLGLVDCVSLMVVEAVTSTRVREKASRLSATCHALFSLCHAGWFGLTPEAHLMVSLAYFFNEVLFGRKAERLHGVLCFSASYVALTASRPELFDLFYQLMWLEASTPFLHLTWCLVQAKSWSWACVSGDICVALFLAVRVLWLPWFLWHVPVFPAMMWPVFVVYYVLTLYWFRLLWRKRQELAATNQHASSVTA